MQKYVLFFLLTSFTFFATAQAKEGMFMPQNIDPSTMQDLKKLGLKLDQKGLIKLLPAIAKVAHGGTGSFISKDGLLITNHHVAYRCIAAISSTKKHWGILEKGYYAKTAKDELSCPGYDFMVVQEIKDVTKDIKAAAKGSNFSKKLKAMKIKAEEIAESCMKNSGFYCEVKAYDGGIKYYLTKYMKITDVRLVYAPPKDIGFYGGDKDNWRYPRHTGDFSILRAYVSSQGKSADFNKNNKPYNPKSFLKIAKNGIGKGKLTMVLGFPGRTMRHRTSFSAKFQMNTAAPLKQKLYASLLKILDDMSAKDSLIKAEYASLRNGLANASKYYADSIASMKKNKLTEVKQKQEKTLRASLKPAELKAYNKLMKKIEKIYDKAGKIYPRLLTLSMMTYLVPGVKGAFLIARWNRIKNQKSKERKYDIFKDKNLYRIKSYLNRIDKIASPKGEKAFLTFLIKNLEKISGKKDKFLKKLFKRTKSYVKYMKKRAKERGMSLADYYYFSLAAPYSKDIVTQTVDIIYGRTAIFAWTGSEKEEKRTLETRKKYFAFKAGKIKKIKDPLLQLGVDLDNELARMEKKELKPLDEELPYKLRPELITKYMKAKYHDANFTLRLSYGITADYTDSSNGKHYPYMTSLKGMLAKFTGKKPFNLPASFVTLARKPYKGKFFDTTLKDVPLDFTTKLDTTGGNSGSPIINANGELIGLLFDGTPESILSDWFYREDQRSICFDVRFALYLMKEWSKADRIIKELGM